MSNNTTNPIVNGFGTLSPTATVHIVGKGSNPTLKTVGTGTGTNLSYVAYQSDGTTVAASLTDAGAFFIKGVQQFGGTNTTGSGSAALGSNSPATTNTAPYTWIQIKTSDGSTAYIPAWK
jgi:hypothetical protein